MEEKWRYRNEKYTRPRLLGRAFSYTGCTLLAPRRALNENIIGLPWTILRGGLYTTPVTVWKKNPQASKSCITILQVIASNLASHTFNIFWMPESFCVNFRPFTACAIIGNSYCSNGQSFNTSISLFSVMILNTWRLY